MKNPEYALRTVRKAVRPRHSLHAQFFVISPERATRPSTLLATLRTSATHYLRSCGLPRPARVWRDAPGIVFGFSARCFFTIDPDFATRAGSFVGVLGTGFTGTTFFGAADFGAVFLGWGLGLGLG